MSCDVQGLPAGSACTARPTFSIRALLVITAMWAVLFCIQTWQSMIVISVIQLTWLFGCNRTRQAVWMVVAALNLPLLVLVALRLVFPLVVPAGCFQQWAVLPGLLLQHAFIRNLEISTAMSVAAIVTVSIFLLSVTLIRFFPKLRDGILVALLLLSHFSWIAVLVHAVSL